MAPLPHTLDIPDLALSSLELDSRSSSLNDLSFSFAPRNEDLSATNILHARAALALPASPATTSISNSFDQGISTSSTASSTHATSTSSSTSSISAAVQTTYNPSAGSIAPSEVNMKGIQAIFALIGASFVLGTIWFFFWAKNGGFQWRKNDWDEYKSTVLRRKGPNGTTLSNATKSTRLGGGSVVGQGYSDRDDATVWTGTDQTSDTPSIIKEKRKAGKPAGKGKKNKNNTNKKVINGETEKEKKLREQKQAEYENGHDDDVRAYMHEKPARVGGMNTQSDSQYYGSEHSATAYTATDPSVTDAPAPPPPPPQHRSKPSSRTASPEKRQTRRDFSFTPDGGPGGDSFSTPHEQAQGARPARYHSPTKHAAGPRSGRQTASYAQPADFSDVQSQHTKSYHHPIPGLSGGAKQSGGYRRDRRDSLDD